MKKKPKSRKRFQPDKKQLGDIIKRHQDGESISLIAKDYGVADPTIRELLKRNGFKFLPKGKHPNSVEALKPTQFKPGQSGNPTGRPKGFASITERLYALTNMALGDVFNDEEKKIIAAKLGKGFLEIPVAEALAKTAIREAIKGDFKYFDAIWQRIDGKVPDRIAGHDGGPLNRNRNIVDIAKKPALLKAAMTLANATTEDET